MVKEMKDVVEYHEADKIMCIKLLHNSMKVGDNGIINPQFKIISRMTKIPQDTLRNWWNKRDMYESYVHEELIDANLTMAWQLYGILLDAIKTLKERGTDSMTNNELLRTIRDAQASIRLATGQATENISHQLSGKVNMISDDHVKLSSKEIKYEKMFNADADDDEED